MGRKADARGREHSSALSVRTNFFRIGKATGQLIFLRFRCFTLGFGWCGLRLGWLTFAAGLFALTTPRLFLRRLFVILASIIRNVKAASFEDQSSSRSNHAANLSLSPFFLSALRLGADRQWFVFYRLRSVEMMLAFFANVFVCRHTLPVLVKSQQVLAGERS